jgi:hypothetical protein
MKILSTTTIGIWWSQLGVMCQIVTTTIVEGDGLRCRESHTQGYDHTHSCCVCFGMAITNVEVKVLLWNFHCNLIRYVAVDGHSTCERDEFYFSHYTLFIILVFLVGISPLFLLQFAVWSLIVWLKSPYPFYQVNCHLLSSLTQSKCGEFLGLLSLSFPKRSWCTSSTKATISFRLASLQFQIDVSELILCERILIE